MAGVEAAGNVLFCWGSRFPGPPLTLLKRNDTRQMGFTWDLQLRVTRVSSTAHWRARDTHKRAAESGGQTQGRAFALASPRRFSPALLDPVPASHPILRLALKT